MEKMTMLETESSGKTGRPNMRWIDSIIEATGASLQELSRTAEDGTEDITHSRGHQESETTQGLITHM